MTDDYGRGNYDTYTSNKAREPRRLSDRPRQADNPDRDRDRERERERETVRRGDRSRDDRRPPPAGKPSLAAVSPAVLKTLVTDRSRSAVQERAEQSRATSARNKSIKLAPRPPPAMSKPGPLSSSAKKLSDALCDRVQLLMHWEAAEKKAKRARTDLGRCNSIHSDFSSIYELLRQQESAAEAEKAKFLTKIKEADEKLQASINEVIVKIQPAEAAVPDKCGEADSQQSFATLLAEESAMIKKTLQADFDVRMSKLEAENAKTRTQLCQERERNDQLQRRLEALEQITDTQKEEIDSVKYKIDQSSETITKQQYDTFKLIESQKDIEQISERSLKLSRRIDVLEETATSQSEANSTTASAVKAIELSVAKIVSEDSARDTAKRKIAPKSEYSEQVARAIELEVDKRLKELVPILSKKINEHLQKERGNIEAIAKLSKESLTAGTNLRADMDKLNVQISNIKGQVDSLALLLPDSTFEVKSEIDELALQVRTLQSWQDNFTTRPLYKEITDHITATIPEGILHQVRGLGSRIANIESRLYGADGAIHKKRKLQPMGSPALDKMQQR